MTEAKPVTDAERLSSSLGGRTKGRSRDDWLTPPRLLRQAFNWWHLNWDAAPFPRPPWDGLKTEWGSEDHPVRAFVNPPYGAAVPFWLEKGIEEVANGRAEIAVFLLNARTDSSWFHEYILGGAQELWFIKGRVSFRLPGAAKPEHPAFPSFLAAFYDNTDQYGNPDTNAIIGGSWSQDFGPMPAHKDHRARRIDEGFEP